MVLRKQMHQATYMAFVWWMPCACVFALFCFVLLCCVVLCCAVLCFVVFCCVLLCFVVFCLFVCLFVCLFEEFAPCNVNLGDTDTYFDILDIRRCCDFRKAICKGSKLALHFSMRWYIELLIKKLLGWRSWTARVNLIRCEQWQNPGCCVYIADFVLPSYFGIVKNITQWQPV